MFGYINKEQIYRLLNNDRIGFVIRDVRVNDIEEYVNNCIITLNTDGFDTKILTQPKIFINRTDKNSKNLVFLFNKSFNNEKTYQKNIYIYYSNIKVLYDWMSKIGNALILEDYIKYYIK